MTQEGIPTTLAPLQIAYSVEKFVQAFNIGRSTVYEEIRAGRLKVRKAGARTLITHEDALAWLNGLPTLSD
jgi:helix-turn-helix protein